TYDMLTLTGNAVFEDPEHGQRLAGDTLKVWLEPAEPAAKTEKTDKADKTDQTEGDARRLRPHHVEAKGKGTADSPELHIQEPTETLLIWSHDAPVTADLPAVAPVPGAAALAPLPPLGAPAPGPGAPAHVAGKSPAPNPLAGPPAPNT